jgi:hypothetical protein
LTAAHIFDDYRLSKDNTIALPAAVEALEVAP